MVNCFQGVGTQPAALQAARPSGLELMLRFPPSGLVTFLPSQGAELRTVRTFVPAQRRGPLVWDVVTSPNQGAGNCHVIAPPRAER